jgi:hypothetical protein
MPPPTRRSICCPCAEHSVIVFIGFRSSVMSGLVSDAVAEIHLIHLPCCQFPLQTSPRQAALLPFILKVPDERYENFYEYATFVKEP